MTDGNWERQLMFDLACTMPYSSMFDIVRSSPAHNNTWKTVAHRHSRTSAAELAITQGVCWRILSLLPRSTVLLGIEGRSPCICSNMPILRTSARSNGKGAPMIDGVRVENEA